MAMLFPYTYVPHQMDKMQTFIDFIFYAVWCQAPAKGPFRLELFSPNPELFKVMTAFHYDDSKGAEYFVGHVERIYTLFAALSPCQVEQLRLWYRANNDVENICSNDCTIPVRRYADLPKELSKLRNQLETFFKGLYSNIGIAALKACVGTIDSHYKAFTSENDNDICPFCGLNDLLGEYHSTRDAYDHYFPQAIYPFNSINFKNLVPACHHCNSNYKTSKDVAYQAKDPAGVKVRRSAFYPYSLGNYKIVISISLDRVNLQALKPWQIAIDFGPAALKDQIDTWRDVYEIDERYKAKLCSKGGGRYWLEQVLSEWKEIGKDPDGLLAEVDRNVENWPYADQNFLKAPFLAACRVNGTFL